MSPYPASAPGSRPPDEIIAELREHDIEAIQRVLALVSEWCHNGTLTPKQVQQVADAYQGTAPSQSEPEHFFTRTDEEAQAHTERILRSVHQPSQPEPR